MLRGSRPYRYEVSHDLENCSFCERSDDRFSLDLQCAFQRRLRSVVACVPIGAIRKKHSYARFTVETTQSKVQIRYLWVSFSGNKRQ